MRYLLLLLVTLIAPRSFVFACSDDVVQSLVSYGEAYQARSFALVGSLKLFSSQLDESAQVFNGLVQNKKPLTEKHLMNLIDIEGEFIDEMDTIYDEQEVALEEFGSTDEAGLFSDIINCVESSKKESFKALVDSHLKDVNIDDSLLTSIFSSFEGYSSVLMKQHDEYSDWLAQNDSLNVPKLELFQELVSFNRDLLIGKECVNGLIADSFRSYCRIEKELEIQSPHCEQALFQDVAECK